MKVEYGESSLGFGQELRIAAADFRQANSKNGWDDHEALLFAVQSFLHEHDCINDIAIRDLEEAARHIKKDGKIILVAKRDEYDVWCEVYAIADNIATAVIKRDSDGGFVIHYSQKTLREKEALASRKRGK